MILISHRGNINGTEIKFENSPDYIFNALNSHFDVEIDVWLFKNKMYLGHDEPTYEFDIKLLNYSSKLWFHAKNLEILETLKKSKFHYFWHQEDDVTLTSKGFWWTYPGKKLFKNSICVLPEINEQNFSNAAGCCSDYVNKYK